MAKREPSSWMSSQHIHPSISCFSLILMFYLPFSSSLPPKNWASFSPIAFNFYWVSSRSETITMVCFHFQRKTVGILIFQIFILTNLFLQESFILWRSNLDHTFPLGGFWSSKARPCRIWKHMASIWFTISTILLLLRVAYFLLVYPCLVDSGDVPCLSSCSLMR